MKYNFPFSIWNIFLLLYSLSSLLTPILNGKLFVNLDFEESLATIGTTSAVTVPGWQTNNGFWHNTTGGFGGSITLFDTDLNNSIYLMGKEPLEGNFSAFILARMMTMPGYNVIGQRGDISSDMKYMEFVADYTGDFRIDVINYDLVKGQEYKPVDFLDLGPNPYNSSIGHLYAIDISTFSGNNMGIYFQAWGDTTPTDNWAFIDAVQFSNQIIPEPAEYAAVFSVAAILFAIWRKRAQ